MALMSHFFSLTFKLNGFVRHVRIEHDQGEAAIKCQIPTWTIPTMSLCFHLALSGNFSFGSFTKFKSTTIVDFIENAVEHSRSGRYLFFLHRRPVRF